MIRWFNRSLAYIVPLVILFLVVALRAFDPGSVLEDMRLKVFDYYQRFQPRKYEPTPVRVIDLDDESLEKIGQWPWPRTLLAEMVANLTNAGAKTVTFDIVFSEPDRTSPKQVVPLWPETPELDAVKATVMSLPDHDVVFGETIGEAKNVVTGFVLTSDKLVRAPVRKGNFALGGDDPGTFLPRFTGAVTNLAVIEKDAAGNGSFNMDPDSDGVVRRVPLVLCLQEEGKKCNFSKDFYPTLSAESLRVSQGARTNIIKASGASGELSFGQNTGINNIKIGRLVIPTDRKGQLWIHFTRDEPSRYIPAWKILAGQFDEKLIDGNIVFIGTSASGLKDLRTSPLSPAMPGVEAHVNAVEQVLLNHYLDRPDWADGAETIFMLVIGIMIVVLLRFAGAGWSAVLTIVAVTAAGGACWYAYTNMRFLVDPVTPGIAVLATYMSGTLINYIRTEAEKKQVRGAFAQYLSPALVEQLAKEPDRLQLGGETKNMTFLFCDVRGFTTISEQFKTNPQGLTRLMNRFLTPLTDVILARQGTIDKYMGDCIMAFWNAPLDVPQHPKPACESALTMFEEIAKLNVDLEAEAKAENRPFFAINIGIGLNSGDVVVGNMGSTQRFDYSVLGDAVNLASRLEGQSKTYGVDVVIGDTTYEVAKDSYATIELDLIAVKGKKEAVRIHALLGRKDVLDSPEFKTFYAKHSAFLAAYRAQRWEECEAAMVELRQLRPHLYGLYDLYEERIADYRENPPGENWDGVFKATSK